MDNQKIGARIKYAREIRNKTLLDIADDIGVAKSTIQRYENGLINKPKLPVLQAIAASLKVNPSWLTGLDVPMELPEPQSNINIPNITYESISRSFGKNASTLLKYYNELNSLGKNEALKRVQELSYISIYTEPEHLTLSAAHERTDIEVTDEMKKHDDDIMMNDEFWN